MEKVIKYNTEYLLSKLKEETKTEYEAELKTDLSGISEITISPKYSDNGFLFKLTKHFGKAELKISDKYCIKLTTTTVETLAALMNNLELQ